jgi:hypothetical protein
MFFLGSSRLAFGGLGFFFQPLVGFGCALRVRAEQIQVVAHPGTMSRGRFLLQRGVATMRKPVPHSAEESSLSRQLGAQSGR